MNGMTSKTHAVYRKLDVVPLPEDVPELGVTAGHPGVVDFVYDEGRGLHVEVGREDGTTAGFVQLEADEAADGGLSWRVVAFSTFGD